MRFLLLSGVALNWAGAARLAWAGRTALPAAVAGPSDYLQMRLFTAGTAAVFGSLYLYLFIRPAYVVPFLIFGATLKTWAFVMSLALYLGRRLGAQQLIEFGVTNLVVALAFWAYIATRA